MDEKITNNTFTDLLDKNNNRNNNNLYVERIGKITKDNTDGTFGVEFIEVLQSDNNQIKTFIPSCPVSQDCSDSGGNVKKYNIGDVVRLKFTDIDYRRFFIKKETNTTIVNIDQDILTHLLDNVYIAGHHNVNKPPIPEGWFSNGAKYSFDDNGKLDVGSKDIAMKEVLNSFNDLCDFILSLKTNIISASAGSPCTITNIEQINTIKQTFQENLNKLLV